VPSPNSLNAGAAATDGIILFKITGSIELFINYGRKIFWEISDGQEQSSY
jgi:hypothetical protein